MAEIQMGIHTIRSHGAKLLRGHWHNWVSLAILLAIDGCLNLIEPFHRYLGSEMITADIKYPLHPNSVPFWAIPVFAGIFPICIILIYYYSRRDVYDLHHGLLGLLHSILVTIVMTDSIKIAVGRPRPNFFFRCFPNGIAAFNTKNGDVLCSGIPKVISEGYKSFPSGHTSFSFAGLGFLSWYLFGKVQVFDGRGHAAKICVGLFPNLFAALIGISRVDDYWHHWSDVFAGSLLGSVVAALCYLQFFPFPHDVRGWAPYEFFRTWEEENSLPSEMDTSHLSDAMAELELMESGVIRRR